MLGGKVGHIGTVTKGMIRVGDTATLAVDGEKRSDTCKNHSATHLLQKALREGLGTPPFPVRASMRRTPAATPFSDRILKAEMAPVFAT